MGVLEGRRSAGRKGARGKGLLKGTGLEGLEVELKAKEQVSDLGAKGKGQA